MVLAMLPLGTVILDPATAFIFGSVFALVSIGLLRRAPEQELPRTAAIGAAWGVWYGLCVSYFLFTQPDWMLAYLRDMSGASPWPVLVGFLLVLALFGAAGALAAGYFFARGRFVAGALVIAFALVNQFGLMWLQWEQYIHIGTYAEFVAGQATPLVEHATMQRAMNVATLAAAGVAFALLGLRLWTYKKVRGVQPSAVR
jgi:hypothetical protein